MLPLLQGRDLVQIFTFRPSLPAFRLTPRQAPSHLRLGVGSGLPPHRYRASQARTHHYYGVHSGPPSPPITALACALSTDALSMSTGQASPVTAPAPCTIDRPQARITADRVSGFALFCTLTPCMPPNQVRCANVHSGSLWLPFRPTVGQWTPLPFRLFFPRSGLIPPSFRWTGFGGFAGNKKKEPEGSFFFDYRGGLINARQRPAGCRSETDC